MIQHRDPGDESEAAMTDERAAVEHKRCPLCGSRPRVENHKRLGLEAWCGGDEDKPCFMRRWPISLDQWNTRPIEDALRAENERLKAENASLKEANEIDLGEKAPLIFENTELSARVSELTRLLAEAEAAIRTLLPICDGDCGCEGTNLGCSAFAEYDPEERHMPAVQRALQSGEGKEPSR